MDRGTVIHEFKIVEGKLARRIRIPRHAGKFGCKPGMVKCGHTRARIGVNQQKLFSFRPFLAVPKSGSFFDPMRRDIRLSNEVT
ncbi:MAG TPA: hypothetical protein VFF11_02080, partial [Candidatus Binatia bacterium]|nr:hypothetical protein [Candidatus Binatia bacterium]